MLCTREAVASKRGLPSLALTPSTSPVAHPFVLDPGPGRCIQSCGEAMAGWKRWDEAVAGRKAQLAELEAKVRELEQELQEGRRQQEQQQQQQQQISLRTLEGAQRQNRGSLPHKHGLGSSEQPSEPSPSAAPAAAAEASAVEDELQAALEASESPSCASTSAPTPSPSHTNTRSHMLSCRSASRLRPRRRAKRQAIRRSYSCGELSPAAAFFLAFKGNTAAVFLSDSHVAKGSLRGAFECCPSPFELFAAFVHAQECASTC
eukprot:1161886-Pelagomonas_calceolata.AAC.1